MNPSEWYFTAKLAFPWNVAVVGPVLLGVVALFLVVFTVWSYRGHPQASRGRLIIVMSLRLAALLLAVLTAVRPGVGIQEKPNIPTKLLIGIDLSESMTIKDEFGGQTRIEAVRKILEKAQPTLDALATEQNCEVLLYQFGATDFQEGTAKYDPKLPAIYPKSDYGVYLAKTLARWQGERFIRGHLLIGDGADNGSTTSAAEWAAKWRPTAPIHTFAVGDERTQSDRKDVAILDVVLEPDPVAVKNSVTLRARVNALGCVGLTAPVKVEFDLDGTGYKTVLQDKVKFTKATDNRIELTLKAPEELPLDANKLPRKQIKVRVEIPAADVPGDTAPSNNVLETYLTLNKEGLRVLIVNRLNPEYGPILDALAADPRIDVRKVDLQTDDGGVGLSRAFDFDQFAYDVLILGNITPKQLAAIEPGLPEKIAKRVKENGLGLMMIGGHATLAGSPDLGPDAANGWRNEKALEEVLPVSLVDAPRDKERDNVRYQVIPEPRFSDSYLTKLGNTREESLQQWDKLNLPANKSRFTGLNRVGKVKNGATVYLWARDGDSVVDLDKPPDSAKQFPLLVGQQFDSGSKSRVLVFTAQDTYMWKRLGLPKSTEGIQLHSRFWRQLVLWLAKQDEEDSSAFIRPDFPRLAVGAKQGFRMGLKGPNGQPVTAPNYEVSILSPSGGEAKTLPVVLDAKGEPRAEFNPSVPGEYTVKLKATGNVTDKGNTVAITGEATARFFAYPEVSDELLVASANYDVLKKLASDGGGKFYRLSDLPAFLNELRAQPLDTVKPRPKYLPDWRRDHSGGFLTGWLVGFAVLLLTEWGLRRWWGLV